MCKHQLHTIATLRLTIRKYELFRNRHTPNHMPLKML